jgi:hypothetical protein
VQSAVAEKYEVFRKQEIERMDQEAAKKLVEDEHKRALEQKRVQEA